MSREETRRLMTEMAGRTVRVRRPGTVAAAYALVDEAKARRAGLAPDNRQAEVAAAAARQADDDAAARNKLAAARKVDVPPPRRGAPGALVLDWAQATGRITAASRADFDQRYQRDPQQTDALLRILAPVPYMGSEPGVAAARSSSPVAAAAGSTQRPQTATGLDVSVLPSRMRAAAARMADPTMVVELIQEFGGKTNADADPLWLRMCGYTAMADAVAQDDYDAYQQAAAAYMAGTGPNPEGLPDLYAE